MSSSWTMNISSEGSERGKVNGKWYILNKDDSSIKSGVELW